VTDFIEFTFINFPVFNCADIFIDIGIGLILIAMMSEKSAQPDQKSDLQPATESAAQHDPG
ncbi:MAG: signal peptidase II, partial [Candidatus Obscuribacterales bacterium]